MADTVLAHSRHLRAGGTGLFIQPSVSLKGGWVDAAMGYRLFWIRYSPDRGTYTPEEEAFYHLGVLGRRWLYFTEPALMLRVRDPALPWLMVELQWVVTLAGRRSISSTGCPPAASGRSSISAA
jgi:hypothetical protein